jgi:uracil-DNA glycosylase family 4
MNRNSLLAAYLRQQKELGMPDMVFGKADKVKSIIVPPKGRQNSGIKISLAGRIQSSPHVPERQGQVKSPYGRLSKLPPPAQTTAEPKPKYVNVSPSVTDTRAGPLTFEQKRGVFKELYAVRCDSCALAKTRKTFVFGSGNVDAPLMIIGEAPGAEEDLQGLPFVGAAGQLLTELLAAIALDRKKDVFITNVLKCRPPDNRTPDSGEIIACMPLLQKQIQVIAPRFLLLLGRIAAHALLGTADSIAKLRGTEHTCGGIPAVVTYHPAAILRNPEYRGPTGDDLQKVARLLKESGYHGTS